MMNANNVRSQAENIDVDVEKKLRLEFVEPDADVELENALDVLQLVEDVETDETIVELVECGKIAKDKKVIVETITELIEYDGIATVDVKEIEYEAEVKPVDTVLEDADNTVEVDEYEDGGMDENEKIIDEHEVEVDCADDETEEMNEHEVVVTATELIEYDGIAKIDVNEIEYEANVKPAHIVLEDADNAVEVDEYKHKVEVDCVDEDLKEQDVVINTAVELVDNN